MLVVVCHTKLLLSAQVLQMLEYYHLKSNPMESEAKRWVLKAPIHLGFISDLVKVFPDADIIWCHRDLASNMLSFGTMLRAIQVSVALKFITSV